MRWTRPLSKSSGRCLRAKGKPRFKRVGDASVFRTAVRSGSRLGRCGRCGRSRLAEFRCVQRWGGPEPANQRVPRPSGQGRQPPPPESDGPLSSHPALRSQATLCAVLQVGPEPDCPDGRSDRLKLGDQSACVMSWALPQALGHYGDSVAVGVTTTFSPEGPPVSGTANAQAAAWSARWPTHACRPC